MALKDTSKQMRALLETIQADLDKAEIGNKAAAQRVRTCTIKLEKVAKLYRKESVKMEKAGGPKKKTATKRPPKASKAAKKEPARPSTPQQPAPKRGALTSKKATAKLPKKRPT